MKKIYTILLVLFGIAFSYNFYTVQFKPVKNTVVFVDVQEVFDSFILTQEKEKELSDQTQVASRYLDSLAFEIQAINDAMQDKGTKIQQADLKQMQNQYYQRRTFFENNTVELTQKFDSQILLQMKKYIADFGKSEGYSYVLSKTEEGVLLYGDMEKEVTDQVITYINNKYQGE